MSGIEPAIVEEDKAQSTLGSQSALMSMLNMGIPLLLSKYFTGSTLTVWVIASNFGLDLPEIEDEGETDEEDEEIHSSRGMYSHFAYH